MAHPFDMIKIFTVMASAQSIQDLQTSVIAEAINQLEDRHFVVTLEGFTAETSAEVAQLEDNINHLQNLYHDLQKKGTP